MDNSSLRNLLITGAQHKERMEYATSLSMELLCRNKDYREKSCGECINCQRILKGMHPNVFVLEPLSTESTDSHDSFAEKQGEIKIEQVRQIILENQKANCEEGVAIFIISHMHQMTVAAANALLKSIEENNPNKVFFALAPSRAAVLPTICSRLIVIKLLPAPLAETISDKIALAIHQITSTPPVERFALVKQWPNVRALLSQEISIFNDVGHDLLRAHFDEKHSFHHLSLPPSLALPIFEALNFATDNLHKNANPNLVVERMLFQDWPFAS